MHVSLAKYVKLTVEQKNAYTARVADLLTLMEANRLAYVDRSSEDEYEWAHQFAVAASQLDALYRLAATTVKPGEELNPAAVPRAIFAARDRAMFDNVLWALHRQGPQGRVAVWAHNAHISKKSVPGDLSSLSGVFAEGPRLGMFLDERFDEQYVGIGTAFYEGQSGWQPTQPPAGCGTIDRELNRVGPPAFILDLKAMGRAGVAADWFAIPRLINADNPSTAYRVRLPSAWDALVFVRHISPVQTRE
jgi:erythromycin esterase